MTKEPLSLAWLDKSRYFWACCAAGCILLFCGTAAILAWRDVPAGMDRGRWALLAALAAPAWIAAGAAFVFILDYLANALFRRSAFGLGLGIVFFGTMALNAGKDAGRIGKLMGLALGAVFCVLSVLSAVIVPIVLVRNKFNLRGQGSNAQGRN